jgi:hypothetical protein
LGGAETDVNEPTIADAFNVDDGPVGIDVGEPVGMDADVNDSSGEDETNGAIGKSMAADVDKLVSTKPIIVVDVDSLVEADANEPMGIDLGDDSDEADKAEGNDDVGKSLSTDNDEPLEASVKNDSPK